MNDLDRPSEVVVSLRLPAEVYDRFCQRSFRTGDSVHRLLLEAVLTAAETLAADARRSETPPAR